MCRSKPRHPLNLPSLFILHTVLPLFFSQVELAVDLSGNAEQIEVQLGLDACASVFGYQKCGSDLTSSLPYYVLDEQYDFSNYCE